MPFNPIINTSPENITENLRILIEDERLRRELVKKEGNMLNKYMMQIRLVEEL